MARRVPRAGPSVVSYEEMELSGEEDWASAAKPISGRGRAAGASSDSEASKSDGQETSEEGSEVEEEDLADLGEEGGNNGDSDEEEEEDESSSASRAAANRDEVDSVGAGGAELQKSGSSASRPGAKRDEVEVEQEGSLAPEQLSKKTAGELEFAARVWAFSCDNPESLTVETFMGVLAVAIQDEDEKKAFLSSWKAREKTLCKAYQDGLTARITFVSDEQLRGRKKVQRASKKKKAQLKKKVQTKVNKVNTK
jgi:hypothetical protein